MSVQRYDRQGDMVPSDVGEYVQYQHYKEAEAEIAKLKEENRKAPVQGYAAGIPWWLHLRAYDVYSKKYGRLQSPEEIAARRGFGVAELDMFVPGWKSLIDEHERLKDEIAKLKAENAALRHDLEQLQILREAER